MLKDRVLSVSFQKKNVLLKLLTTLQIGLTQTAVQDMMLFLTALFYTARCIQSVIFTLPVKKMKTLRALSYSFLHSESSQYSG